MNTEHLTQWVGGAVLLLGVLFMFVNRGGPGPSLTFKGTTLAIPTGGLGLAILGAAMMVGAPLVGSFAKPDLFHVTGRIQLHEKKIVRGLQNVVVGIIPMGSHATTTADDGSYKLSFPRGTSGQQYQVFLYQSNPNPARALSRLGVVLFDPEGRATHDHTFDGR